MKFSRFRGAVPAMPKFGHHRCKFRWPRLLPPLGEVADFPASRLDTISKNLVQAQWLTAPGSMGLE